MMKKTLYALILLILLCFVSCNSPIVDSNDSSSSEILNTTSTTSYEELYERYSNSFPNVEAEFQKYPTNLEFYSEQTRYPVSVKSFQVQTRNHDNQYFLTTDAFTLEYFSDGEWKEILPKEKESEIDLPNPRVYGVYAQADETYSFFTDVIVLDDYDFDFVAGKYRFVKSVATITLTLEFELY